jgi:hypothetical protein
MKFPSTASDSSPETPIVYTVISEPLSNSVLVISPGIVNLIFPLPISPPVDVVKIGVAGRPDGVPDTPVVGELKPLPLELPFLARTETATDEPSNNVKLDAPPTPLFSAIEDQLVLLLVNTKNLAPY